LTNLISIQKALLSSWVEKVELCSVLSCLF